MQIAIPQQRGRGGDLILLGDHFDLRQGGGAAMPDQPGQMGFVSMGAAAARYYGVCQGAMAAALA